MTRIAVFVLAGAFCALGSGRAAEFRVNDYGAKGDGKTVDTAAIQAAIDAAAKSHRAIVSFKPGVYLTGAIFLKSGIQMRVDEGVEIHGVQDIAAYPIMATRVAGIEMQWPAALINVYQQTGVTISGKGLVDGDGKPFWDLYRATARDYVARGLRWAADYDCRRPRLIQIFKSSKVKLEGLTLKRAGFWTVHLCYSTDVTVDGLTIRNNIAGIGPAGRGPSTDGIDIDSSSRVVVMHCDIECNDDAICFKAGRDADGLRVNRPTFHVLVHDCTIRHGAAGITFGSETSGGIHDVVAYNLHVIPDEPNGVSNAVLFKSASTRGGTIYNINIHDVDFKDVPTAVAINFNWNPSYSYAKMPEGVKDAPDYWRVLTTPVPPEQGLPHLRQVRIANLKGTATRQAFSVNSYKDSPLLDFVFKNLAIAAPAAGAIQFANGWRFERTSIQAGDKSKVTVKDSTNVTGLK